MISLIPINIIPVIMIIFGVLFTRHVPRNINSIYGYRTPMSKKNKNTWEFAHHYCGKLWIICGVILLAISILASISALNVGNSALNNTGKLIILIDVIILIASIFPTEAALKKNFDKDGKRRI